MKKIVIAIDGFSGCGKSSTAKQVAKELGYTYIDSGAMYRAATLHFINKFTELTNPKDIQRTLDSLDIAFHHNEASDHQDTYLNGLNVEKKIRSMEVSEKVSEISKIKEVRQELVAQQQRIGKHKGVVMDGRDIGTVVFPEAELKVFMTADTKIRAERRQKELLERGELVELDKIIHNLQERDRIDSSRSESPLKKADDAVEIDTSLLGFEEQIYQITDLAKKKIEEN
ncbi:(d)CMP kinase [Echinicola strongylocentroti]|uniref:Cytidylate kinase n=1 Tax=Echinicola strongylocentroti TaxID=1795355 RepID=A0A2Z4IKF8_9BACT|nr:(d)CMP kinase [Echinicola strongylocentroti]AWW31454.1 (d)CMP kinase [Echinicola strongylocentroti]